MVDKIYTTRTVDASAMEAGVVIPKMLPGELIHGWRGRVRKVNSLTHASDATALLARLACRASLAADDPDFLDYAAAVLGTTREELLKYHTLQPFHRSLTGKIYGGNIVTSAAHQRSTPLEAPFRIDGKFALFCGECAREDAARLRLSYWRRSHHLTGVCWCQTHRTKLLKAGGIDAFDDPPHAFLNSALPFDHMPSLDENLILSRYVALATEVLDGSLSIDKLTASIILNARIRESGLRYTSRGKRPTLSSLALEKLPRPWLEDSFRRISWNHSYVPAFDGACQVRGSDYTTGSLCLIAALLFPDVDQAINQIFLAAPRTHEPRQFRSRGFDYWASHEVFSSYAANGGMFQRVAEDLAIDTKSTREGLLSQGLPGLGHRTASMQALYAFFSGESIEEACHQANASQEQVEALLRTAGARLSAALDAMGKMSDHKAKPRGPYAKRLGMARVRELELDDVAPATPSGLETRDNDLVTEPG